MGAMVTPSDIALQQRADRALRGWAGGLGPSLAAAFDEVAARLGLLGTSDPGYFLHPLALPVLQLPVWLGEVCAARGRIVPPAVIDGLV